MEPKELAAYFLSKGSMTHKKLQKLCYYAQCWYYGLNKEKLISSDFEAWIHGPVSPVLYHEFKVHGWHEIGLSPLILELSEEIKGFLSRIFDLYGAYSGEDLEALTHSEIPWKRARGQLDPTEPCTTVIKYEDMYEFCQELLKETDT